MLYENYRKKIIKVADILKTVRKFRVLIITFLIALLCVMAVLLGIQGVVFDMSTPPAVIVYGQPFEYEAGAVMGSVRYEYAEEGSDEWTAAQPVRAGSYKVRAVAKGAFGGDRYGAEHSFTIEPKPIDVTLAESSAVYGEQPLLTADLAFSDVIRCVAFSYDYSQAEADISEGTEIRVFDENGEDVTSSYTFRSVEGTLLIEQRAVAITTDSAEKVYDGTPLTDTGYTVSADTPLAENDSVYIDDEADLTVQATITAAGSVENSLAFFFKKSITVDGEELFVDVTSNYAQEITYGTLTVKKRPVTFETASQSWVYDGEAHSNGGHVIAEGEGEYGLLNGHMMAVDESTLPQATEAGEVQNAFTIRIESAGEDMTDNYDVTYSYGTLTIKPRPVIFVTEGHEWVYDGTAHSWGGYSVAESAEEEYGLVEGHASAAVGFTYVTNVADSGAANVLTVAVYDGERDVTGNYAISYDEENAGKLTIKPRSVTFVTEGHEWVYDGEAHSWGGHSVAQGSENGLAEGHTSEAVAFTCVTDVANSGTVNKLTVAVYDDAEDVTANYEIAYDADGAGILTVTPRAVVIATATDEKVYDGTPLENGGCSDSGKGTYELVEGHRPVRDGEGTLPSVTDVLYDEAQHVIGLENIFAVRILDADGTDRTDNYAVGYDYGTLTVTPRPIKVRSDSAEKVYDAASLTAHGCEITEGTLAAEQTLTADYTGSVTNVWESAEENNLFTVTIRDAAENNVTANYAVTYEYGTLTITPRPIVVTAASGEKVYDAEPFGTDDFVGGEYYLVASDADPALAPPVVAGQTLAVETQLPESADVYERGEHTLTPEDVTVWAGGTDVTANYAIRTENGTVTIKPRTVTFVTESRSWVYDGEAHSWDRHAVAPTSEYGLVEGHTSRATELVYITDVLYGENGDVAGIPNALVIKVYDADGAPVAVGNYSILYECGTLTVTPRPIVVTAASGEKVYDGMPFGSDDFAGGEYYLVASGADPALEPPVAAGQTLEVGTQLPESADVYESGAHTVVSVKVWADGTEVTANYSIRTEDGAVMIAPRPITVTAGSADKVYDGTPLVCATYNVTSDIRLVEGHTLTARTVGSRTDVGSSPNEIDEESVTIVSADGTDVSRNYQITEESGMLTVLVPGVLVVRTGGAEKIFDGTALTNAEYTIESTLGENFGMQFTVEVSCTGSILHAGKTANTAEVRVEDSNGEDVTKYARIEYELGLLKIAPRPAKVVTGSAEWEYDGEPHSYPDETRIEAVEYDGVTYGLVQGHEAVFTDHAEIVMPGTMENDVTVTVTDGGTIDFTDDYEFEYELGTLEIIDSSGGDGGGGGAGDLDTSGELGGGALGGEGNATVLRVRADVSEYVYFRLLSFGNYNGGGWVYAPEYGQLLDGAYGMNYLTGIALSQAGYTSSQIAIEMKTHDYLLPYYMATGAGDYTVQTSDVWYKGDTSAAYSLPFYAYDYVRDGALTAGLGGYAAAEEAYRAFVYENYLTVRESARACMQAIIAEQGFRADDPAIVTKVAAYIQNAAAYNLEYDRAMDDEADVVVAFLTKYKEGICQHYASAATLLFRELGIPARYTVGYVGETVAGEWTEIGAANAHAWVEVYLDGVGWVHVEVTGGGPGGGGGGSGQQEELTIKPVNKTKKFDGKPLKADAVQGADEASALRLNELLTEGYTYKAEFAGSITEPGTTESTIENFVLYDPQGAEAENVTFTFEPGTLTVVSNILITIHPYVLQKYYDGTQLAYKADDYWVSGLQSGWRIEGFSMEGIGLTDVGAITADSDEILERLVGVRVYDESGILRTEGVDYTLVIDGSTLLTVDRRAITVSSYSDTKPYDGEPLTNKNCWISSGNLANGHIFEATVTGSITDVGTKQNTIEKVIIRDGDGNEVTKNYNIVFSPGWLTVLDG